MSFEANLRPPMEAYKEYLEQRGGGGGNCAGFSIESLLSPESPSTSGTAGAAASRCQNYCCADQPTDSSTVYKVHSKFNILKGL